MKKENTVFCAVLFCFAYFKENNEFTRIGPTKQTNKKNTREKTNTEKINLIENLEGARNTKMSFVIEDLEKSYPRFLTRNS